MRNIITFSLFFASGLAKPFELISKRPLGRSEWAPSKRTGCPAYLPDGEYEFPHYITQISASQPDKSFGPQYDGVFTPNDISSIFSFDIPASRTDWNCTLEFLFPSQSQLKTSSYTYSGGGTFVFTGYLAGSCPGPQTTYNNQPTPGIYPAFPAVHMEPGYAYTLDVGPCFVSAGTCVAGCKCPPMKYTFALPCFVSVSNLYTVTSTTDTNFEFFQDIGDGANGDCPIGIFTTYSKI